MGARQTPSQTVGPFFHMRLEEAGAELLVPEAHPDRIDVVGQVFDVSGEHIEDALVELWQANATGRYRHPHDTRSDAPLTEGFTGFGRSCGRFDSGAYRFVTVKPGRVPHPDGGLQAPHCNLIVQSRGMLNPLHTRVYFGDEEEANRRDPVLQAVPPDRRATLVARPLPEAVTTYRFDIRLGGADETVFFDF